MKTLLFFTSHFPFGEGEIFIENEFPFLVKNFDRIFVITTNLDAKQTRPLPEGVEVIRLSYSSSLRYRAMAVLKFLTPPIQTELAFLQEQLFLPIKRSTLSELLIGYSKALEINNWLQKFVAEKEIDKNSLYLYGYWMNNMAAGMALYKEQNPMVKAFCRAHGWDVYFERHSSAYLPLRNFMLDRLDACFCISENGQQYIRHLQIQKSRNNIQLSRLGTFNIESSTSKFGSTSIVLVSCSHLIPLKRVHLIIEALSKTDKLKIHWVHFGIGKLLEQLKSKAEVLLTDKPNISYEFKGQITNAEMLYYYRTQTVDLFINTSETEGLPVSMMEAISFGVPVIGTRVGGVKELIADGVNGYLLPPDLNAHDIVARLVAYVNLSAEAKDTMHKNAQIIWREKFDAVKNYPAFIEALEKL